MKFVIGKGSAPLHPFNALPIEYFETETINREATLELCCKLVDACDEFWLFGISEGTLTEATYFFAHNDKSKPIKILVEVFDPGHAHYLEKYRDRFKQTLDKLGL